MVQVLRRRPFHCNKITTTTTQHLFTAKQQQDKNRKIYTETIWLVTYVTIRGYTAKVLTMPTCATWIEILPSHNSYSVRRSDHWHRLSALLVQDGLLWTRFRCGHGHLIIPLPIFFFFYLLWSLVSHLFLWSALLFVSVRNLFGT